MAVDLSYILHSSQLKRADAALGKKWPLLVAITLLGAAAVWQWVLKPDLSPVLSYGAPSQTFFKPAEVTEGDTTFICFHGAVWHRLCPSTLVTYLKPNQGDRLDLPSYPINLPPQTGPVEKKCRPWVAPKVGDRSSQMIFSGFAESLCGKRDNPVRIITQLPAVPITINKL